MQVTHRPTILIVLDGWGHTDNTEYNAIYTANKPVWDKIWNNYPHTLISASGIDVGLPASQMGNSEVGHMSIGSGRVVDQEFTRITRAIEDGSFYNNETLNKALNNAAENNKAVHLLGLLSPGGVHSHEEHIFALMELAAKCNVKKLYLHAFLDGRDTPPKSAEESIHKAQVKMRELGIGRFASLIGRYFAMDRNKQWDRTKLAYDLICQGKSDYQSIDPFIAVDMAYSRGETDEFLRPTSIIKDGEQAITVEDDDVVIFANYRADRARQLARAFTKSEFKAFEREQIPKLAAFVSLTSYKANYEFPVAFPAVKMKNVFGEYISKFGLKQLRIAETEKYAHVTFFFNGGKESVFEGEDRILVPSPHVDTYNQKPEMSAEGITERLIESIESKKYDTIICNYANADMVGHTGDFKATVSAIETIDKCLGKVIESAQNAGGEIIITADHGNAEQLKAYTTEKIKSQAHTAHTSNLVPLIYIGRPAEFLPGTGSLSDISPTLLCIMGIEQPEEMTGTTLLRLTDDNSTRVDEK
ncbi:MAG: 2,3-bisphosphoglycerate-independent phosphoglycerate mutase [Proteobacteria bacterium]|nr:2,3-bisphosphoglycerate-independent phosphoglycerate mutase [Pseudomonadota bacterium]NOG60194.1 2,3-bisphosphoglycerate-independent phosphoglycerate mutase [Pseudomonadota bacterium]